MTPEASIVVFVTGLASEELPAVDAALESALGAPDSVLVSSADPLPRDVDAFERARSRGASAVVELSTDPTWARVDLRVCSSAAPGAESCAVRSMQFATADSLEARRRALAIVAVAMLPEATRQAALAPPAPVATRAAPPRRIPAPAVRAAPARPRFELELAAAGALGAPSTFGGAAAARIRLLGSVWAHAGAGVRAGTVPAVDATTLDVPLDVGVDARLALDERWGLGARVDGLLQHRSVSFTAPLAEGRGRWLVALRAGPEVHLRCSRYVGLLVFAGVEVNAGHTRIELASGERAQLGVVRAALEVGPYLTF